MVSKLTIAPGGSFVARGMPASYGTVAGIAYLGLNLLFLAQNGAVNPNTDTLRAPLLGFVVLSMALLGWFVRRVSHSRPKN